MQNGIMPHREVFKSINNVYKNRVIDLGYLDQESIERPSQSQDLNSCDFFVETP